MNNCGYFYCKKIKYSYASTTFPLVGQEIDAAKRRIKDKDISKGIEITQSFGNFSTSDILSALSCFIFTHILVYWRAVDNFSCISYQVQHTMSATNQGLSPVAKNIKNSLQDNILASLGSNPGDSTTQCAHLQPFLDQTKMEACQIILENLVQLHFSQDKACQHWDAIVQHADILQGSLDRTVGLATVACDYFSSINPRLTNPKLIEHARLEETLQSAHLDYLTKLLGRRAFQELFEQEISRAQRHKHNVTLIFFDLDNFKSINDEYGHLTGDETLRQAGRILLDSKRKEDLGCRYGGDEFIVLLPETDKAMGALVAKKLHKQLNNLSFHYREKHITTQCSAGLASFPEDAQNGETLLDCADKALYKAKCQGRNRLVLF